MRKQLLTAVLALAAIPGIALGDATPPALFTYSVPASEAPLPPSALPPLPVSAELLPRPAHGISPVSASRIALPPSSLPPVGAALPPPTAPVLDSQIGHNTGGQQYGPADWACRPPSCFWARAEYLMWWIKDSQLPALVTTGVPGATLLPGAIGQPGTRVVFGGTDLDNQMHSGGRFTVGFWLDDCQTVGIEGSYFFLASRSVRFDAVSSGTLGSPIIARPFFDVLTGAQNSQLVAFPGLAGGEIHAVASSRLQGAELNLLCVSSCTPCPDTCTDQTCRSKHGHNGINSRISLLGGIRYLQLDEGLGITEITRVSPVLSVDPALVTGSPLFAGSTITIHDQIDTHNYFYGGQIGAQAECCWRGVFANVLGKVALGATHQVIDIRGATAITSLAGTTVVTPTGFLASGRNSGRFTRDRFAVVPELGANVGCQLNKYLRVSVGYTFLYWSAVVRPGDQVDVGLSGTQIRTDARFNPTAGPARPAVLFRETDFWAQGVNFGLEFRY